VTQRYGFRFPYLVNSQKHALQLITHSINLFNQSYTF